MFSTEGSGESRGVCVGRLLYACEDKKSAFTVVSGVTDMRAGKAIAWYSRAMMMVTDEIKT